MKLSYGSQEEIILDLNPMTVVLRGEKQKDTGEMHTDTHTDTGEART